MIFDYFTISSVINAVTSFGLCALVLFKNRKSDLTRSFSLFSFCVGFWSTNHFLAFSIQNAASALFFHRLLMAGAIFIPTTYFHFVCVLLDIESKYKKLIIGNYIASCIFLSSVFTPLFITGVSKKLFFNYFENPGILYHPFLVMFLSLTIFSHVLLYNGFRKTKGLKSKQIQYIFIGTVIGFIGGSTSFFLVYNIPIPPIGNGLVSVYIITVAIAILRYRLMDIRLVVTNISIFFLVYAIVLSIPLWLGYKHHRWEQSVWLMLLLATAGPYIYTYLRKQAENKLLQEQIVYQKTLRQAAYGIGRVKKLGLLLKLIERVLKQSVGIEQCAVYLIDDAEEKEHPGHSLTNKNDSVPSHVSIPPEVLNSLMRHNEPFILEELSYHNHSECDVKNMVDFLKPFHSEIIIPIVQSDKLLSLILLGKKRNGSLYTNDDITVFTILASQAGLAIENCLFFEAEQDRLKREGAQARRESLDMMVSTMAHEIDNPLTSVITNIDIVREEVEGIDKSNLSDYSRGLIERAIKSVIDDSFRVTKIIDAIREYSKGSGDLKPVLVYDVLDTYRTLFTMIKKDFTGVEYTEEIEENLPHIYAEPILIEEILINFARNAVQAVEHNKNGKKVALRIYRKNDDYIRIEVQDNGPGIPPRVIKQLYVVPATTKGSAVGTGIGLYRVRQICEILKTKYGAESEGEGKGALMYVEIPIHKGKIK